jgi:hypothetical protein
VLLASSHLGKHEFLRQVQVSVSNKDHLNFEMFQLCLEILFPSFFPNNFEIMSMDHIRAIFRFLSENTPHLRDDAVALIRSLRIAEVEDKRKQTKLSEAERQELWRDVHENMLHLASKIHVSNRSIAMEIKVK